MAQRIQMRSTAGVCAVAALSLAMAACSSIPRPGFLGGGDDETADAGRRASVTGAGAEATASARVSALAPRDLDAGECGLFLWTRGATGDRLVFYSDPESETAAIAIDGEEIELRRLQVVGAEEGGRFGQQVFSNATGSIGARLSILETEEIEGGARVGSARLRVFDEDGWATVLQTAGVAGCRD